MHWRWAGDCDGGGEHELGASAAVHIPLGLPVQSAYNRVMLTDEDKQWISERLQKVESQFSHRLEKVETTLLTEFHKWASPVELRQRSHAAALRALDSEV